MGRHHQHVIVRCTQKKNNVCSFGGGAKTYFALVLGGSLADERGVVDETVLGSLVLGLEGAEEGLLGTEDLNGGGGVLGQVDERTGVSDETSADELAHHHGQVGSDGLHAVLEVVVELRAVLVDVEHLRAQVLDVEDILLADLRTHGDLGRVPDLSFSLFGQDAGEAGGGSVVASACVG